MANLDEAAEKLREIRYGKFQKVAPKVGIMTGEKRSGAELKTYWAKENQRLNKDLGNSARLLGNVIAMPLTTKLFSGIGKIVVKSPYLKRIIGGVLKPKQIKWAKRVLKERHNLGRDLDRRMESKAQDISLRWMREAKRVGIKVPQVKLQYGEYTHAYAKKAFNFLTEAPKRILRYFGENIPK